MIEYTYQYLQNTHFCKGYPAHDLRPYSFHTGTSVRTLDPDECCPLLFRDLGIAGMDLYLNNQLTRLAGPLSPITYLRTEHYQEPYIDYEQIGRIVLLRPLGLHPWHSGLPSVYVSRSSQLPESGTMAFIPGYIEIEYAAQVLASAKNVSEVGEAFGRSEYTDAVRETRQRVRSLIQEMVIVEKSAEPLRKMLKSLDAKENEWANEVMEKHSITEADLCCAWNHISRDRRKNLSEAVREINTYGKC